MATLAQSLWKYVKAGWMNFAFFLGWINTRLLLSLTYLLLIGPTAMVIFLLRKDLLRKRLLKSGSYWIEKERAEHTIEQAKHQF